ncbi:hypothetical protein BDW42DRAFT_101774 [Aspergillus taichungensis]|uniref:Uncharacterized protein n=1 Tax=Aspergillus taichungensis TaxID=482145 RepID=A0A2J5HUP7_9EURO|nr:hypothetical protein BDW42DRAFT_101774 [Aspergillus taichungensis]
MRSQKKRGEKPPLGITPPSRPYGKYSGISMLMDATQPLSDGLHHPLHLQMGCCMTRTDDSAQDRVPWRVTVTSKCSARVSIGTDGGPDQGLVQGLRCVSLASSCSAGVIVAPCHLDETVTAFISDPGTPVLNSIHARRSLSGTNGTAVGRLLCGADGQLDFRLAA